ncbi:MFS transporter [Microbacterium sp. Leaf179]|uniref:MFS transporter n=1 Tax=Microbacterium sp. Leaf179 TaxID=1736288 RepID=UPI0006FAE10C|nr:MFS transporter [Microbacterium sp. Leaf179]KQR89004.1 MFS transporter [Microbacterium sp. Leaf179]
MTTHDPDVHVPAGAGISPAAPAAEPGAVPPIDAASPVVAEAQKPVSRSYILWLMLASFGGSMAMMVPLSYGIALRISELAPGQEQLLGVITGIAQVVYLLISPLVGLWSDRTRSRWGRRTPFLFLGAGLGLTGLLLMGFAPNLLLVGCGWVLGMAGWSISGAAVQTLQADKLPDSQRGKVSALTNLMNQVAPILGIGIAYAVSSSTLLVFAIPGLIGAILIAVFPFVKPEGSSKALPAGAAVTLGSVVRSYGFDVRRYPDFSWNWLGRFIFFIGLYFNTTFGTFFYAQRLDLPVREVAGVVASIGMLGVVAATGGALLGGFLSDRLKRRRLFVAISAVVFVGGAVTEAFAWSLPQLIIGAVLMQLAIAIFATVDQAIIFAILPDRSEAGRYMAVVAFAQKIPSAVAPLIAAAIISIGAIGAEKNYTLLYLIGASFALVGGLMIVSKVKAVR